MTLIRFNPARSFERAQRKMNEMFNDLDNNISFEMGRFQPKLDIIDNDKAINIYVELPGMNKDDIKISVNEDKMLVLKGKKESAGENDKRSYIRSERSFGEFSRSIVLPENIDIDHINAKFNSGILELSIPKTAPKEPKEIDINIG